jgi:predicted acyl esterase
VIAPHEGATTWSDSKPQEKTPNHAQVNTPMYHVTSWYDIFLRGGLALFCGLRQQAMSAEARTQQKILIGPWAHRFPYTSPTSQGTGDRAFVALEALLDSASERTLWLAA